MEFLGDVVVSERDQSTLGVFITKFDPNDYLSRASVKLYTMDELKELYTSMQPCGFKLDNSGALFSDTSVPRCIIDDHLFSYMYKEGHQDVTSTPDLTDLVLLGVVSNGYAIPNGEEFTSAEELESTGIFVPFSNFKVSNSSFNIYASYDAGDHNFKTLSLLKLEDGSSIDVFIAMPKNVDLSPFSSNIQFLYTASVFGKEMQIYKMNLGLKGANANVGEGFLNYLAYNIAFYNIGEKVMREVQVVVPKIPSVPVEPQVYKQPRRAEVNVSIEHVYKKSRLKEIIDRISDTNELDAYLAEYPDAQISFYWAQQIYQTPWYESTLKTSSEEEAVFASCTNLLPQLKKDRMKYALELLSQRYYIHKIGFINDTLGAVLKGGGVHGESLKCASW